MYCMLFKAAVVTLWTFVEYFVAIPATPVSLECSSGFSARGRSCPHCPPFATPLLLHESLATPRSSIMDYHDWCTRSYTGWTFPSERVNYKLRVLTHRCLLGKAPVYLSNCCIPVSQVATRRHLRSAARHQLTVPRHRLSTYGRRAFAVAGPTMFITLPDDLRDPVDCSQHIDLQTVVEDSSFLCLSARLTH